MADKMAQGTGHGGNFKEISHLTHKTNWRSFSDLSQNTGRGFVCSFACSFICFYISFIHIFFPIFHIFIYLFTYSIYLYIYSYISFIHICISVFHLFVYLFIYLFYSFFCIYSWPRNKQETTNFQEGQNIWDILMRWKSFMTRPRNTPRTVQPCGTDITDDPFTQANQ